MLDNPSFSYQVYVLRLWRDGPGAPWRAALENSRTGERFPFASLSALFAFLESETQASQMAASPDDCEDSGRGGKSQTTGDST